ncbi:filamentous hemagglutinin N-terminal domain-containing protein [Desulfosarcina variabilis]|uniref:two-partner secretion domain-containing protein n=1 Tax=Desulfosarcina variabilis TaxID=2300 RepID=UPI003AFABB8C
MVDSYCFHNSRCVVLIFLITLSIQIFIDICYAEVSTDGSLGPAIDLTGPDYAVTSDLGQIHGSNLFHSFQEFSIQSGESATFSGPVGINISNIISRVTGGNPSYINGMLRSTIDGVDFFLLNPSGVLFGPSAELDINGSFHASTADYLRFDDGTLFQADPTRESVLSVARPEAFGFLTDNPADIEVRNSHLAAPSGETIALTGGDIRINGADITAPDGRIQIVAVGKAGDVNFEAPEVLSVSGGEGGSVNISNTALADLNHASDAAGTVIIRGGRIELNAVSVVADGTQTENAYDYALDIESGSLLELSDNSYILGYSLGSDKGRDFRIKANEFVMQNDSSIDLIAYDQGVGGDILIDTQTFRLEGSSIVSKVYDQGDGGDISINTQTLTLESQSSIEASSYEYGYTTGNIGSIRINAADSILVRESSSIKTSAGLFSQGNCGSIQIQSGRSLVIDGSDDQELSPGIKSIANGSGNSGDISVWTDSCEIRNGSISSEKDYGVGNSGSLLIEANSIHLDNGTISATGGSPLGGGNVDSGDISIRSKTLEAFDGSTIKANVYGSGDAGSIDLVAENVLFVGGLDSLGLNNSSGIYNSTSGTGDAGDIQIRTNSLTLLNCANITSGTSGTGNGGDIFIETNELAVMGDPDDQHLLQLSSISTSSFVSYNASSSETGNAGNINITVKDTMHLSKGGYVSVGTSGTGKGGVLEVSAGNILINGSNAYTTGLWANSTGEGDAGSIQVSAEDLRIQNSALIYTEAEIATGGNININAGNITLLNGADIYAKSTGTCNAGNINLQVSGSVNADRSTITTEAAMADGGNIRIIAGDRIWLSESGVSTSVGGGQDTTGGNLDLQAKNVVLKDSQLKADAFEGNGGNIAITADGYLADPSSIVDASSALGIDGMVDIRAPFSNLSGSLKPLPKNFLSATNLLKEPCEARVQGGDYGSFTVKGRDALPVQPGSLQKSPLLTF